MATVLNRINSFALKSLNYFQTPLNEIFFKRKRLYLYCFSDRLFFHTLRNNLGDDLNIDFIESISGRRIIKEEYSMLPHNERYAFIGSIMEYVCSREKPAIIWGTGFKFEKNDLSANSIARNQYLAVRGPLSREIVLKAGGACPDIYGDPGILLSKFMAVKRNIKFKYGIIPHKTEYNLDVVQGLKHDKDVLLLDIVNYGSLRSFLEKMCSCEYIISSSLHGIIMADSYGIPNIWCRFSPTSDGGGFKFHDYFKGAHKNAECMDLSSSFDEESIMKALAEWQKPSIDKRFIEACPFTIIKKEI